MQESRQILIESIVLAVVGGIAGIAVAGTRVILVLAFQKDPVPIPAWPSLPVLAFAFAVSLLTGILFGVGPAWLSSEANPVDALRGANRSTANHGGLGQKSLVVMQAALSLVLLCAAGPLTYGSLSRRTLARAHRRPPRTNASSQHRVSPAPQVLQPTTDSAAN